MGSTVNYVESFRSFKKIQQKNKIEENNKYIEETK